MRVWNSIKDPRLIFFYVKMQLKQLQSCFRDPRLSPVTCFQTQGEFGLVVEGLGSLHEVVISNFITIILHTNRKKYD